MAGNKSASTKTAKSARTKQPAASKTTSSAADVVDDQLAKYRSMRDFQVTQEPSGAAKDGTAAALPFCIQKHAASHFDWEGTGC